MHPPQLIVLEEALSNSIQTLKSRNQIFGPPPTINEVLDPKEEQEIGDSQYAFEGGDTEIVAAVQHELAVKQGEIAETVESDDEPEDRQMPPKLVYTDLVSMCETLEAACIHISDADSMLDLVRLLRQFHGTLHREELWNACVQSKLDQYFIRK
ncbi:hypothetical protein PISMIDRAFT_120453 [Pisolithus microcarpus 441]|uniref:Uncharacterized protein n=1 Tax=Pisolithus microcarpus 441 TaxID=765257 RepID=A0A0C9YXL0_9AGAM|nr:hypothetical protein PISMIDRAFT_120453 [Pisolithus microcarpus 441]